MAKYNFFVQFWIKNVASSRMASCDSRLPAELPFRSQIKIEASDSPLPSGLWVKRLITHALCSLVYSTEKHNVIADVIILWLLQVVALLQEHSQDYHECTGPRFNLKTVSAGIEIRYSDKIFLF